MGEQLRILVREMEEAKMEVDHDGTTIQEKEQDWICGDDLSLCSLDEADYLVSSVCIAIGERDDTDLGVELDGTTIQPNEKDWKNGDHLSLYSFDEEDFLNPVMDCAVQVIPRGSARPDQETRPLWESPNRQAIKASLELLQLDIEVTQDVMNTDAYPKEVPVAKSQRQGQVGAALIRRANEFRGRRLQKIQTDMLERILREFAGLYEVMDSDHADHNDVELHEIWQREIEKLHMACRACRALTEKIDQVYSTTKVNPSQEEKCTVQRFDLLQITPVVPFTIEDDLESPPLTPPTPEALLFHQQLSWALSPLNRFTIGVVTPSRPEETLPAVGCLPHSHMPPITHSSAYAKKLLQGGLEEYQQDVTEDTTGIAKAMLYVQPLTVEEVSEEKQEHESKNYVKEKKKKKKNVGKRFLRWLVRKFTCGCCSHV